MIRRVFAGVIVDDLESASAWYARVLGRPPDATPMDGLLEWHLAESGWFQVVAVSKVREVLSAPNWGKPGASSVAFVIESLADQLAVLEANDVPIGPQFDASFPKTATVSDPAGNFVTFVEEAATP